MQLTALGLGLLPVLLGFFLGAWIGEKRARAMLLAVFFVGTLCYLFAFLSFGKFQVATDALSWASIACLLVTAGLLGPAATDKFWSRVLISFMGALLAYCAIFYLGLAYACAINAACL